MNQAFFKQSTRFEDFEKTLAHIANYFAHCGLAYQTRTTALCERQRLAIQQLHHRVYDLPSLRLSAGVRKTSRGPQRGAPRHGGGRALKSERWCMTLARQGYSHRTIAEIAGVTPEGLRSLIGSSSGAAVYPRRKDDRRRLERRVSFEANPSSKRPGNT